PISSYPELCCIKMTCHCHILLPSFLSSLTHPSGPLQRQHIQSLLHSLSLILLLRPSLLLFLSFFLSLSLFESSGHIPCYCLSMKRLFVCPLDSKRERDRKRERMESRQRR